MLTGNYLFSLFFSYYLLLTTYFLLLNPSLPKPTAWGKAEPVLRAPTAGQVAIVPTVSGANPGPIMTVPRYPHRKSAVFPPAAASPIPCASLMAARSKVAFGLLPQPAGISTVFCRVPAVKLIPDVPRQSNTAALMAVSVSPTALVIRTAPGQVFPANASPDTIATTALFCPIQAVPVVTAVVFPVPDQNPPPLVLPFPGPVWLLWPRPDLGLPPSHRRLFPAAAQQD